MKKQLLQLSLVYHYYKEIKENNKKRRIKFYEQKIKNRKAREARRVINEAFKNVFGEPS